MLLLPGACFESPDQLLVEGGVEDIEDICQGSVNNLVVVGQAVELVGCQVQVNSVAFTHTVDYRKSAKIQITRVWTCVYKRGCYCPFPGSTCHKQGKRRH